VQKIVKTLPLYSRPLGISIRRIVTMLESSIRATIYAIFLAAPLLSPKTSPSLGVTAAAALFLVLLMKVLRHRHTEFYSTIFLCLAATVALISNNQTPILVSIHNTLYNLQFLYNYGFIYLFISTLALILLTFRRRYLLITPTDFLLITIPLILLLLPEQIRTHYHLNIISVRSLILFAAIQLIARRRHYSLAKVELTAIFALSYISFSGILGLKIMP
jgi:hypothetical protein